MERMPKEINNKAKRNRVISIVIAIFSVCALVFCIQQVVSYVILKNENARLNKDLEQLKQDSNYVRGQFDVLKDEKYYSVYIEGEYQYVDGNEDSVSIIK